MKKYITVGTYILILLFSASMYILYNRNLHLKDEISIVMANQKAFIAENTSLKEDNRVFKFTVELLNYYNDSILLKMDLVRKELRVKDKNLQLLLYKLETASKSDTLFIRDTIFKKEGFLLDTTIMDEWYKNRICLKYPNIVSSTPEFTMESYVVISSRKELVNPPKRNRIARFFLNIFGRKHTIVEVNTRESNPYVTNKSQRYVQIIE